MINHGISTGALFLLVGILYERRHTRMISEYGGLAKQMPVYATYFMIMVLSSMGLPLLNGFIGEFTILQGAFAKNFWWAFFAATGIVLGAAYLLWLYQRLFFGEITNPANAKLPDLTLREQLTLLPLVILALWIGLYPGPIFRVIRRPSEKIVQIVGGATAEAPAVAEKTAAPGASGGGVAARP
jgi:NADH-quinone oxidoreductase subunit M